MACQYSDLSFIDLVETYSWKVWLNYAVYWALQTISTLGYGDITPRNPVEVAYCDIVIIGFCFVYPYFLNAAWEIIVVLLGKHYYILGRDNIYKNKSLKLFKKNYKLNN